MYLIALADYWSFNVVSITKTTKVTTVFLGKKYGEAPQKLNCQRHFNRFR